MTKEEITICKMYLEDLDNTHTCNEYKLLMELLEQPTSDDCVSRKAVAEIINKQRFGIHQISMGIIKEKIESLPPVTPTCKVGKWIENDKGAIVCSCCNTWFPKERKEFMWKCPYCFADMRGSENG